MEQTCNTTMKTTTVSNVWTVQNYSSIGNNMKLRSMMFNGVSAHSRQPVAWYYQLEKQDNSQRNSSSSCMTIEAFADSTYIGRSRLHVAITLECQGEYYDEFQGVYRNTCIYPCTGHLQANAKIGQSITVQQSAVSSSLVKNNILTLRFQCTLYEEVLNGNPGKQGQVQQIPDSQLVSHLDELFTKNKYSDVTLTVGKKQFHAHKAILAVRSPVFAAMFEHDMQEAKENTVKITDLEPEVLQEVLRFIYTGTVQKMDQHASVLLMAAEKYALDNLKSKCGEHLGSTLSVETATATLALADKYNAGVLKQQAIQFISKHVKQLNPADWKEVLTNNFDVAAEIIAQMVKEK